MKKERENTTTEILEYSKAGNFFHCKHCIEQFLGSELHCVMTPREYGSYEVSSYPLKTGETIVVVWCKKCGREVWDSREL